MIKIKDRKRQRLNRRLKHKEELLDNKNDLGVKDLTAYNAVKQMVTNGKASIVLMENHILYTVGNWSLRINFQRARNHAFPFVNWKNR